MQGTAGDPLPANVCPPQRVCLLASELKSPRSRVETSTLQALVLISAERADIARGGALCKKHPCSIGRGNPPCSQQPWLTLRKKGRTIFFLIFHFEGAFIVPTATRGRKSDVVLCPPRPPRPLGLLGTLDSTVPGSLSSRKSLGFCWNCHIRGFTSPSDCDPQGGGSG